MGCCGAGAGVHTGCAELVRDWCRVVRGWYRVVRGSSGVVWHVADRCTGTHGSSLQLGGARSAVGRRPVSSWAAPGQQLSRARSAVEPRPVSS